MSLNPASTNATSQASSDSAPAAETKGRNAVSWMHRFAALVAILGFLWIVLGSRGLDTRFDARLAVAARDSAAGAAVLLAVWLWLVPSARALKILSLVEAVFGLGAAGGIARSLAGAIAQNVLVNGFFCLTVCAALFTRIDWRWDEPKTPDLAFPSFRQLSEFTAAALFVESALGGAYQAGAIRLAPHLILGVASAITALWMLEIGLNKFAALRELKIAAVLTGELVALEIFLGLVAYSMELNARVEARRLPGLAVISATHAAAAALALAASLFLMFEALKYLSPCARERTSRKN